MVKWLGQVLSMPIFPGSTWGASTATQSSVSSYTTMGTSVRPSRANIRLANSVISPLSFTSSASMRSKGSHHTPVR